MGALVGILFCAYTVAKVQRDAIFLAEFGALALPYAYVGVAIASVLFVWLEGRVVRRFTRIGATRFNQYVAIGFSLVAATVYPLSRHWTAAAFYLWTGSQAMILLPHFWVLALDVWDSRRARRLFPLFSACGLIGGLAGGSIAGWLTPFVKRVGLMWIVSGLLIVAHVLTRSVDSHRLQRPGPADVTGTASRWQIIRRSTYIKFLAAALALSVVVATIVDFQFKYFAQNAFPDPHELTQFLGKFQAAINALALVFQFAIAGWLLRRLPLVASTGIQPVAIMALGGWTSVAPQGTPVVLMRGVQGVFSQVLGKSSAEIYYMAVRPPERRRIKPAIDTLVERWSDAVVGVLLIVALRVMGVGIPVLATVTVVLAAIWLFVILGLNRQYQGAMQKALSSRWMEAEAVADSIKMPSARAALVHSLNAADERQVVLALRLSEQADNPVIIAAIRRCLRHPSPAVRAAAVQTLEAKRLRDDEGIIDGFLRDPNEGVRRAAVGYLLTMSRQPTTFVRGLLDGDDPELRKFVLDALFDRPHEAPAALAPQWIDARIRSGTKEDLLLAARALGALPGSSQAAPLRDLLQNPDHDVRRLALLSAQRRPNSQLLDVILPLLLVPDLSYEARQALAAIGDPAIPALARFLEGESGAKAQTLAARTLAQIASDRAVDALMALVRSSDRALRHLGLRSMSRARVQAGRPVVPRATAHRMFLRELREYRAWLRPAHGLEGNPVPELKLLAESYREFAEMALERALRALACWYEPRSLFGAFERLKSHEASASALALEYLGHVLPRSVFKPVTRIFEEERLDEPAPARSESPREPIPEPPESPRALAEWIRAAWESGDAWLKACAVHASRYAPELPATTFALEDGESAVVRAEVEARLHENDRPRLPGLKPRTVAG
ncbi:MAG TPA: Npt1/Npt2 family nucleotide transporter [Candidatus Limnocylindrales bacterium]|nr:Npt1/Npt2 family nucleotide transporter [Candidatus Limnocylindrales bacterium]